MNLGKCAGPCGQTSELHEGTDGRGYCENCLVQQKMDPPINQGPQVTPLQEQLRHPAGAPQVKDRDVRVEPTTANVMLLDYIAAHASEKWIDKFLNNHKRQLKDNYGWVKVVEAIADERVLLRMATELGYGVGVDPTVLPSFKDRDIDYEERLGQAIPKKRANGRSDESYTYRRCAHKGCNRKAHTQSSFCPGHFPSKTETDTEDLLG